MPDNDLNLIRVMGNEARRTIINHTKKNAKKVRGHSREVHNDFINDVWTPLIQEFNDLPDIEFCGKKFYEALNKFVATFDPLRSHPERWWKNIGLTTNYWGSMDLGISFFEIREMFICNLCFSIPTTESLEEIVGFANGSVIEEYMAGTGYWSYLLEKEFNQKIDPSDSNNDIYPVSRTNTFVPIAVKDIRKSTPSPDSTVMLSWIPYESTVANGFLKRMRKGQKLILIGERGGGCCAADSTFAILDKQFELEKTVDLVKFTGIRDEMGFYRKKQ